MTIYQYWVNTPSGEIYAVGIDDGKVVEACGPLYYKDVEGHKPEEYEWDYELADDINEDQDSYTLYEPRNGDRAVTYPSRVTVLWKDMPKGEDLPEECPACGESREHLACLDCGHEADVINCGHFDQPQEIAGSKYSGVPVCAECEEKRDIESEARQKAEDEEMGRPPRR